MTERTFKVQPSFYLVISIIWLASIVLNGQKKACDQKMDTGKTFDQKLNTDGNLSQF